MGSSYQTVNGMVSDELKVYKYANGEEFTMPNWCDCTYKCVGDLKEVKAIYKSLEIA